MRVGVDICIQLSTVISCLAGQVNNIVVHTGSCLAWLIRIKMQVESVTSWMVVEREKRKEREFPLTPMGVLAPVSAQRDTPLSPPSTSAEIFRRTCLQSSLKKHLTNPRGGGKIFKTKFWSTFSPNQAILSTFRFCLYYLGAHAKFGNPTTTLSGRTVMAVEEKRKKEKREKEKKSMIIVVPSCLKDADGARTRSDQLWSLCLPGIFENSGHYICLP